jgi:hypothetical protein
MIAGFHAAFQMHFAGRTPCTCQAAVGDILVIAVKTNPSESPHPENLRVDVQGSGILGSPTIYYAPHQPPTSGASDELLAYLMTEAKGNSTVRVTAVNNDGTTAATMVFPIVVNDQRGPGDGPHPL